MRHDDTNQSSVFTWIVMDISQNVNFVAEVLQARRESRFPANPVCQCRTPSKIAFLMSFTL
jgi:hypothetical protein